MPGSFFTRALDAPGPRSFSGRRRWVDTDGGDPMTTPLLPGVLGVDEGDREDDDIGPSMLRDSQCYRCGIVSRG
jgi:hypothetical protein